ncbi:MAG TPA: thioredoxin family protein [Tahibacter sp.]|uniref:thioredoxin family protein n=1 Tax=Tahibacter sp. TaxID=2056211 RepID=UPI002C8F280F|nr:thioredoxin family protein [Tahibacter sp.]HSX60267.1 thioredoxin family protein [Tahibacter sp.]
MKLFKSFAALAAACLFATACTPDSTAVAVEPARPVAPEFTGIASWLNSPPLTREQLRGKVTLVEFWTYSCINCVHVIPHIKRWHANYRDKGLVVVGVHTPEYDDDKPLANVKAAVERFGITYAVAQDNDYATWNAYGNRFWPALYLIDREGRIVHRHYGEGGYDVTESKIRELLARAAP